MKLLGIKTPKTNGAGPFFHLVVEEFDKADAVKRSFGKGNPDQLTKGRQDVARDGCNLADSGAVDSPGPFNQAWHADAPLVEGTLEPSKG